MINFEIITDASTIAVFDLESLIHRVNDDGDWWTSETFSELREEIFRENIVLIDTLSDGKFSITISKSKVGEIWIPLNCPTKKVYIVCGEEIPGEGLVPGFVRGGGIIEVASSKVFVSYSVNGNTVQIGLKA